MATFFIFEVMKFNPNRRVLVDWPESKLWHDKKMYIVRTENQKNSKGELNTRYHLKFELPEPGIDYFGDIDLPEHNIKPVEELKILCILANAWGNAAKLRRKYFKVNSQNKSGKRMYDICGDNDMYFTNVCPEVFDNPNQKGQTDLLHLKQALFAQDYDLYIACGQQAKAAINTVADGLISIFGKPTVIMPHPAARNFTNKLHNELKSFIASNKLIINHMMIIEFEVKDNNPKLISRFKK